MNICKYARKIASAPMALSAFSVAVVMRARDAAAQNVDDVGSMSDWLVEQLDSVANLIVVGGFIGGLVMTVIGFMKIREANQDGGRQTKYSEGAVRIVIGLALITLGGIIAIGQGSLGVENQGINGPNADFNF